MDELLKTGRLRFSFMESAIERIERSEEKRLKEKFNGIEAKKAGEKLRKLVENFRKSCVNADIALNKHKLLIDKNKEIMKTFENGMYITGTPEKLNHLKNYALLRNVPFNNSNQEWKYNSKYPGIIFLKTKLFKFHDISLPIDKDSVQITSDQFFEYCDNWQKSKQPELEVGQWRKDLDGDLMRVIRFEKIDVSTLRSNKKETIEGCHLIVDNYVCNNYGEARVDKIVISNELPTPEEIKQHLTNIAREKGFPVNVKVDRGHLNINSNNRISIGNNVVHYYPPNDTFSIDGKIIYQKGVWAEIID